jgi:SAM-dependent methyltransferase
MSIYLKEVAKYLLPYKLVEYLKADNNITTSTEAKKESPMPFNQAYTDAKHAYIESVINNKESIQKLKDSENLPVGYGHAFDERIVEYPWIIANISSDKALKLLDIGPVLNYEFCINHLLKLDPTKQITIFSLTPEPRCYYDKNISYVLGDARYLPFADNHFDEVTCISTLEHIGMNNTKYGSKDEQFPEDYLLAINEMKRVLKPNGSLFITVPFGMYQNFGWFQQFDEAMVNKIVTKFNPSDYKIDYLQYIGGSWQKSNAKQAANVKYNTNHPGDLSYYNTNPVAAGAAACIRLIK